MEAMEITSDAYKIKIAAFQLEGEFHEMIWEEFCELFMGKIFLVSTRHVKAQEFSELKQGTMTVLKYVAKFTELACFADDYVVIDMAKVR